MHLNITPMLFKRILTLIFVLVSLFVPIKKADENVPPANLAKVDSYKLFDDSNQFSTIKEEQKSLTVSAIER